jgi:hypothetical protein
MSEARLEYLFDCYINNRCSTGEEKELMALVTESKNQATVQRLIDNLVENTTADVQMPDDVAASILQNILKAKAVVIPIQQSKSIVAWWWRAAAVVILFLAGITYWILNDNYHTKPQTLPEAQVPVHILPGGNRAVLTTSEGETIILDSVQNGIIAQQGNWKISKQGGLLIFNASALTKPGTPISYNTLSTPRGGQYQVLLDDGSRVWLNAASSLKFPTSFVDNQRIVELTGEAYFEVAKNSQKPFLVNINDMQVRVLGTHFNINAYGDEDFIKTSLLEGSIKVSKGTVSGLLKPGEQATISNKNDNIQIGRANMEEAIAWKNGLFQFEGADINHIMNEISRWYNMQIEYTGKLQSRRFEGKISRSAPLSDVLKILELSNVKFEVFKNKIIVK